MTFNWAILGKVLLFVLKFPFLIIWYVGKFLFSIKILGLRLGIYLFFAMILLSNAIITAVNEKDASIIITEVGNSIIYADYGLEKDLKEEPLVFPALKELSWFDKIKEVANFVWRIVILMSHLWFMVAWFILIYWIISKSGNTSETGRNFLLAFVIYVCLVLLVNVYYVKEGIIDEWRLPFQGLIELFRQITGQIPTIKENIINNATNITNGG